MRTPTTWTVGRGLLAALVLSLTALAQPPGPPPGGGGGQGGSGDGIWRRNAFWGEIQTFDSCMGHQPGSGDYHHHANPICLRAQLGDNVEAVTTNRNGTTYREKAAAFTHSPILGWAFDGYPVYGPYGYSDALNAASSVKRLKSSFRLRAITARTSLPDWSLPNHSGVSQQLTTTQYGPAISNKFPLGRYNEDFEFVQGLGDLDIYNGRFEKTPEFPQGTYAYHITIDDAGSPAYPYIFAGQLYGTVSGGRAQTIASGVQDYFNSASPSTASAASTAAALTSWSTKNAAQSAKVVSGFDPSAGAFTTWPTNAPAGTQISGGVSTATNSDVQRVRYSDSTVYVNANGLGSYTMGPWFDPTMTGGIFLNFPANQSYQFQFPRTPTVATTKSSSAMGPQGMWVNGVTIFNFLDGGSYSNTSGGDSGGGNVFPTAVLVSSASNEKGPMAPGSLISAYTLFGAELSTSTQGATTPDWPLALGTTSVTVKDSAGISRTARVSYVSPTQVNFQIPTGTATGYATATFTAGSSSVDSKLYIVSSYPNLFVTAQGRPAGYVVRVRSGQQTTEAIDAPIKLNAADAIYLVFYGSGLGSVTEAKATIGGVEAEVAYAGPQNVYPGLDQFNVKLPASLKSGTQNLVLTVAGRPSNVLSITVE